MSRGRQDANKPGFATRRLANLQADDLYHLAVTDPLTGCYNRRFFDEVIDRELAHHSRYGVPLSLLFLDVDQFKAVNDSFGHEAGDRVLQAVASFLKRQRFNDGTRNAVFVVEVFEEVTREYNVKIAGLDLPWLRVILVQETDVV